MNRTAMRLLVIALAVLATEGLGAAAGGREWVVFARPMEAQMKTCPDCNGDGVVDKGTDEEQRCPTCGGLGFVPDDDDQEEVINTAALPRRTSRVC